MYEVPDTSVPSGTVVQVVQAGFMIGERVLRPALVGVSKGGAKATPAPSEQIKQILALNHQFAKLAVKEARFPS